MARALSQDLRDRVVAVTDGGMSCRAAAVRFGVGVVYNTKKYVVTQATIMPNAVRNRPC